jgi:hypothetical protein
LRDSVVEDGRYCVRRYYTSRTYALRREGIPLPIVQIPSAREVRNGGGNALVQRALSYLEPDLCVVYDGTLEVEVRDLIHHSYPEQALRETVERVMVILEGKGWKTRIFDRNGKACLEITNPSD